MMKKTKVGIIGCGMISNTYFKAAQRFRNIEVVAFADILNTAVYIVLALAGVVQDQVGHCILLLSNSGCLILMIGL